LTVGGSGTLPAGRYWIMIDHHSGEDPNAILRWKILDKANPLVDQGLLADGSDAEIDFGADECFSWWRMPEECRQLGHMQVLYSGKIVELLVARSDTGEVLLRSDLSRKAPYLEFAPVELAPDGAELLIGSYRWTLDEPVSAGRLFLSSAARPLPGPDYFPPYAAFTKDGRGRMLAATVELAGEDGGGTAVMVSPTGLLLSCEHVVEGEEEMVVYVPTDEWGRPRELYRAVVLHSDAYLDLSLLRLVGDVFERKLPAGRPLPFAAMGGAAPLRLGDPILVPGYPTSASSAFGSNLVLTVGVLSGVEEEREGPRWLISDGRYADGNSGSGFFDKNGVVRGIHSMTVGPDGGSLGYARPLDRLPAAWKKRILSEGGRWVE
jgi:S1-C subfamily serine protease